MTQLLRVEDLTKRFAAVTANDRVSFDLEAGEIHCLLGQNGAGKTTLCECLYGYCLPDSGSVYLEGQEVDIRSPSDAIKLGIGMVHQHFVLVTPMTVLENIVVGTEELAGIPNMKDAKKRIREVCDTYGLDIDLEARIWQISVGEQQWVEVLKAPLHGGARILIFGRADGRSHPPRVRKAIPHSPPHDGPGALGRARFAQIERSHGERPRHRSAAGSSGRNRPPVGGHEAGTLPDGGRPGGRPSSREKPYSRPVSPSSRSAICVS